MTIDQRQKAISIYEFFNQIPDHRSKHGKRYPLGLILSIILLATMSGYIGQRAVADFVTRNMVELKNYFNFKRDTLPSRKTIFEVFGLVKFEDVFKSFNKWSSKYIDTSDSDRQWISVDGKAIGGTVKNPNSKYQEFVSMISLFSSKRKEVILSQPVTGKKKSELKSFQKILKDLKIENAIFTLDALHCQKKTLAKIKKGNNSYIVGVKGNQKNLLKAIKKTL